MVSSLLASALRYFSERVGSQCYVRVYFKIQVFNTYYCYHVMSLALSEHVAFATVVLYSETAGGATSHKVPIST